MILIDTLPSARFLLDVRQPAARLLRQGLAFNCLEALYGSFCIAYAFASFGIVGALEFIAALAVSSAIGYFGAYSLMQASDARPWSVLHLGIGIFSGAIALSALARDPWIALSILVLAGSARGACFASKQWMELKHTAGGLREAYFSWFQAGLTVFKLVGPLAAAALLAKESNNFRPLFACIGISGLIVFALLHRLGAVVTQAPGMSRPFTPFRQRKFWSMAPFFFLEGAGATLRSLLFVSGSLTILSSASHYAILDSIMSLGSAALLAWLAHQHRGAPSLKQLRVSLIVTAVAWALLLGALQAPLLFAGFAILYALGNPPLLAVNASLVLKSLSGDGQAHDNSMAREFLIVVARLLALGFAGLLTTVSPSATVRLSAVISLMLALVPLEYFFARKIFAK